jgi:hypothetical protein
MPLTNKPLESIERSDLEALVENKVREDKKIEYKRSLPHDYESKKKCLAAVSSFANAAGGHLIYGIKEEAGEPVELCGLQITDVDAEKLRLENLIRDSIEPRIPGVALQPVDLKPGVAIVIRIPRSWALPHVVKLREHWRFYSRNSAGKYPLDVSELRAAFALSETTAERIRNFRAERLGKIVAGETSVPLRDSARTVLHIIPFGAFDPAVKFDVASLVHLYHAYDDCSLRPISTRRCSYRHNFDGFLTYTEIRQSTSSFSYLQVFRNGAIEAVEAQLLLEIKGKRRILGVRYEEELIDALDRFLSIQSQLGVKPPLFIMLSLLGVHGYTMDVTYAGLDRYTQPIDQPIDRDDLLIPEVLVDNFDCDLAEVMRPAFDAIWNAAGWPGSRSYDDTGKWVGQRGV